MSKGKCTRAHRTLWTGTQVARGVFPDNVGF
uniref:Uncharacterized protein n=1 Tax=Anguilla anguilla TaxID=7936 RepID=A0A0E9QCX4_ANGAN